MYQFVKKNLIIEYLHTHGLNLVFYCLVLLFFVSLFKNISYPLLWADESITIMHGKRVLEYGYPKVHDGKNVVNDLRHSNPRLGIDEKTDAYIGGANWGMYYVAAVAVIWAKMSDDLYTKTAILRIPFALSGLLGLMILAILAVQFFENEFAKYGFLTLFTFFELTSIPLVLHLREARYYPLTVLLTALVIFVYARYRILKRGQYCTFALMLTLSLFLLFVTFSPVYFIFLIAISLYESIGFLRGLVFKYTSKSGQIGPGTPSLNPLLKNCLQVSLPIFLSLIAVSPLIFFFKTFSIAEEMANFNSSLFGISKLDMYLANLSMIWNYFRSSDFIYLAIFLKLCLILSIIGPGVREISSLHSRKLMFSNFLAIIFAVYFFAIAQIPNFPFTRYFIPLQPILAVMAILDMALIYHFISLRFVKGAKYFKLIFLMVFVVFISNHIWKNIEYIKGHIYELSHQYKGPLDYLIPFIKETYGDTKGLVIATNYEETSYMYYLDSKVIVGYVGNNLEQDIQLVPDVVIFRKEWGNRHRQLFLDFLSRHRYRRISFPVFDYKVNNIPELNFLDPGLEHQFRTLYTRDERMKTDIYLKQ